MKKLLQTKLHIPGTQRGNCFAAVIASIMELESADDAIQIQDHFDNDDWPTMLLEWLAIRGWDLGTQHGHVFDGSFYLVTGKSPRDPNINHVVIYQNGEMVHDTHPDGTGVVDPFMFEYLTKEICLQSCESCEKEFDIDTMIEGEQWFCKPCYDELSTSPDFFPAPECDQCGYTDMHADDCPITIRAKTIKIFGITTNDDENCWIAAMDEAGARACFDTFKDAAESVAAIVELPREKWNDQLVFNNDAEPGDWHSMTFGEFVYQFGNADQFLVAGTIY